MDETKLTDWQVPVREATDGRKLDYIEEAVQEGEKWWESQPAAKSEQFLKLLSCAGPEKLKSNSLKSDVRKFVETISDVREIATFGSGAEQFKGIVEMFNDVVKYIYRDSHFPRQSRKALQYAVAMGRGYLWPRFINTEFGWGPGKTEFVDLGPREVLPIQVPRNNDVQGSYGMTIVECMGVAEAHARFDEGFHEELLPISRMKYSSNSQVRRLEFWDRWRYGEQQPDWDRRYCEIRHTFIRDLRINRTGKMLPMGDKNTSWYYEVPSVGSVMSWRDPINHLPASRMASRKDARLYPQLRLIISNPGMKRPLYDGPAFDNHGMLPAIPYDVDDWPWLAVGYSLLHDVASLEGGQRAFLDIMFRVLKKKMNPTMGYDLDAGIPRDDIKNLDLLNSDIATIGVSGDPGRVLKSIIPDSMRVEEIDFKMIELMDKLKQKTLGLNDLASIAQMKLNLSSDNFDKILESIGPIAKGIAGNMEAGQSKIAHMLKFNMLQYMTTRDFMSIRGPDGVATKVFDFEPDSIVVSHMPWETKTNEQSQVSRNERAKWTAQNLSIVSVPSSLLNVTQMQEQMKWLNFLQRGMPVSFKTAFEKLGVEDWENKEFPQYKKEQIEMLEFKLKAAQIAALESPGAGRPDGKGQGKGGGRPPSGKQPPKLEKRGSTDGNQRTVVSQSK